MKLFIQLDGVALSTALIGEKFSLSRSFNNIVIDFAKHICLNA